MRPVLLCAMIAAVAFAGCAEPKDVPVDGADTGSDGGGPQGGNGTSEPTNGTNLPPVAELAASALNGTAPLNVTLTLDGSDPEGANLTWVLSINGTESANGSALPASVNVTLTAGNHTIVLAISDAALSANASLVIQVAAAVVEDSEFPVTLSGDVDESCATVHGCYMVGAEGCAGWLAATQGIDCVWFPLPAHYEGRPFTTDSSGDVDVDFRTDCSRTGESIDVFGADGQEEGEIPAGSRCAVLMDFSEGGTLSMTIS